MWFWCPVQLNRLFGSIYNWPMIGTGRLHCWRLTHRCDYDEESVWQLVQRHGGAIELRRDCVDFWIDPAWADFLILAYPDLERHPELDRWQ